MLKGGAGNGLTDPAIQYGAYADYAFHNKLISKAVRTAVNVAYPPCRVAINQCNAHPKWHGECLAAHAYCQVRSSACLLVMRASVRFLPVVVGVARLWVAPVTVTGSPLAVWLGVAAWCLWHACGKSRIAFFASFHMHHLHLVGLLHSGEYLRNADVQ